MTFFPENKFHEPTGSVHRTHPIASFFALVSLLWGVSFADEKADLKFFENEVRPLLSDSCFSCHGEEKQKGGLRLDHIDFINKGGESEEPLFVSGKPEESLVIEMVKRLDEDYSMPPKGADALSPEKIAVLEKWIAQGAPWPSTDVAAGGKVDENGFTEDDHQWWAIQPVVDPKVPTVEYSIFGDPSAAKKKAGNAIDAFVFQKLNTKNLQPAPKASKDELVRRAYFDLHGLPPTPEQVAAFVKNESSDAWPKLIDELLASPRYGERWASHWLDVVRFAESDGYRADDFRSGVWRYRDYVIQSLNADKPYDEFVREQLAADEFAANDPEKLIATAFLRLGVYEWNQRNAKMQWDLIMTEMTNVTSEAFLGLGIGCAQCHDHKFDPILQKDHFAMRAFLSSSWWPEHEPIGTPTEHADFEKKQAGWEAATAAIRVELDKMTADTIKNNIAGVVKQFPADVQKIYNTPAEKRTAYEEQITQLVQRQVDKKQAGENYEKRWVKSPELLEKYKKLTTELAAFAELKPKPLPLGFITTDVGAKTSDTLMKKSKGEVAIEPAFLTLLGQPAPKITPTKNTTGRRTALANWIADEKNPFSTRVIVNRIWQRHFGRGIVQTPNDFGMLGQEPSHPELLDWLTSRFLEGGWKMKPLHRLIMTSETYQQTARREPTTDESTADPFNKLLWRFSPQRLQAEEVRDAMLAASGEMKDREGGASIDGKTASRSVFVKKRRNSPDEMMAGFDSPSGFGSTPNRIPTTTPTQSLMLVNGEWAMVRAKAFATRVLAGKPKMDAASVAKAYEIAYGRSASQVEIDGTLAFIKSQSELVSSTAATADTKFPSETGLRPIKQKFGKVSGDLQLGENALWLQPDSKFAKLDFSKFTLPTEEFTIEAIANLDAIHADANVNTLVGKWNGSKERAGWTFGATSAKSAYQPRNFIMQFIGNDFQNNLIYEVVASDLRFPTNKPTYIAASVSAIPSDDDETKGMVTFYMRELDDPKAPLQKAVVPHQIVGGLDAGAVRSFIGGREQNNHWWDGQLARLVISEGALTEDKLLISSGSAKDVKRVLDFDFSGKNGEQPAPNTAWFRAGADGKTVAKNPKLLGAVTDFCHALLTSNEFLYLH